MMKIGMTTLGNLNTSRLIVGGNPFSGFSHQGAKRDAEMSKYYTTNRIKSVLRQAEKLGINTCIARADRHITRMFLEYWDEGGSIQWIAQTCSELASMSQSVENAIKGGAKACYLHGGQMDYLCLSGGLSEALVCIKKIKDAGLAAGIAGHMADVFVWAEKNIVVDFYMCSYYNPQPRLDRPDHVSTAEEVYNDADREAMVAVIEGLSKPAIHYKVMAAGRHDPVTALSYVASHLRSQDAVCIGVYVNDDQNMLEEDLRILDYELAPDRRMRICEY
jgi:hypothetical protein